jgi:hypothetical protein
MEPEHKIPRVAVIAVHGVADQKPYETARAAADLLAHAEAFSQVKPRDTLGQDADEKMRTGRYQAFEESDLRILVKRLLPVEPDEARPHTFFSWLQQSQAAASPIKGESPADDLSYDYMREQLRKHVLDEKDAVFETIRLESTRTGSKAKVAVFELYWADLSRFVGNWLRWIIEFYQLLFFLCLLGRKSLEFARASYERPARTARMRFWRAWPFFGWCQVIAESALVLFVPVLNICLLGIASCILPLLIPAESIGWGITAFLALAAAVLAGFFIYRTRMNLVPGGRSWPWWLIAPIAVLGGAAGLCVVGSVAAASHPYLWLELVWWLVPCAIITFSMGVYDKSHPGALGPGLLAVFVVTAIFVVEIISRHTTPGNVMDGILRAAEWTLAGLRLSWLAVLLAAIGATFSGFLVPSAVLPPTTPGRLNVERDKARRAAWTANLAIVLPALVVIILNLTLWQAILSLAVPDKAVPAITSTTEKSMWPFAFIKQSQLWNAPHKPIPELPWVQGLVKDNDPAWKTTGALMAQSYTPFYWLICALFSGAALLLVWSISPAVIAELRLDEQKNQPLSKRNDYSSWLGESLSAGFRAMRISGEIVRWTYVAVLPLGIITTAIAGHIAPDIFSWMQTANYVFLGVGVWLVLALIVAKGPFKGIALGLHSALDVALDVINWLRLYPLESNPRARICARFSSLLRHIEEWEDPYDSRRFKAIVILAHSQGTVITADLLRFLNHPSNSQLAPKLPIYLFTMGNPLRQLYSLRFPHLYSWARHYGASWAGDEPLPAAIGVTRWVNAYRSGDYVGRYIWHPDDSVLTINPIWSIEHVHVDGARGKREFCIGSGAHTHYWDETAPEIALELDRLVGLAAQS